MIHRTRAALMACSLAAPTWVLADDLHVPAAYPTIQAAVDAAADGDAVVLAEGTYRGAGNLEVRVTDKRISIRGESPTGAVIVGPGNPFDGQLRAMTISGPRGEVTVRDLEFRGCTGEGDGGAVRVFAATVVFERVTFTENRAVGDFSGEGGAVWLSGADATFRDCAFVGNGAAAFGGGGAGDGQGGAVWAGHGGRAVFERCVFERNRAGGSDQFGSARGGAIRASEVTLTLRECVLASNSAFAAGASGGGISSGGSTLRLIGTDLVSNSATGADGAAAGGGISATGDTAIIGGSVRSNRASDWTTFSATGGGFRLRERAELVNVIVSGNSVSGGEALGGGGALGGDATVTNCTFTGNSGSVVGGLEILDGAAVAIHSSIVRDGARTLRVGSGATLAVEYTNIEGGYAGPGNIDADPMLDSDRRLLAGSPCIDAGDSTALPADAFDLDGDGDTAEPLPMDHFGGPRRSDDPATPDTGVGPPVVDMGAGEFATCRADLDGDGELTVADFLAFQNLFGAMDPRADFDGDGSFTIFDFLAFQNAFDAGCA